MSRIPLSDDDLRLWREVMRDVHPMPGRSLPPPPAPLAAPPAPAAAPRSADLLGPRPQPRPMRVGEGQQGTVPGIDKRSTQRLRRGQLPVEGRLDLHGMNREQAHAALNGFLAVSQQAGRRTVLVITGKGETGSGGVLRSAVPRWLHEGSNRERVLAYTAARPQHGGEGAIYVLLRRVRHP